MRLKRDLFFTLILFLIIFSISFASASEITYDSNTDELTTLSVSDVNSIDEDLNDVKLDSVEENSNDELIHSVDDNLDESELNSIDDTSSPSLDLEDDEQDIDEIESNDCLTLNDKAQLLRASDNEEILGGNRNLTNGTAQDVMNAILDVSREGGGTIYLNGGTYSGNGELRNNGNFQYINNVQVIGGSPNNPNQLATFTGGGYVLTFRGDSSDWGTKFRSGTGYILNNFVIKGINATGKFIQFCGGALNHCVIENCYSALQFMGMCGCYEGGQTINVSYCDFINCHQTYRGPNDVEDGTGQLGAVFGVKMDHCNFINTSSAQHGGALCIADESEWGSRNVTSVITNTNFINVTSRWFAIYIHGNFSTSTDFIKTPELIENCSFIDCVGTGEYSGGIGLSHSNAIIRNCEFNNSVGGQGAAIMVGGISEDHDAFSGRNTVANNVLIENCNFTNNIAKEAGQEPSHCYAKYYDNGTMKHPECWFYPTGDAGAIFVYGNDTIIRNCIFKNNTAEDGHGAAINIVGERTIIENSEFYDHKSDNGTVYLVGNNAKIINSKFYDNEADAGACIFIRGNNAEISSSNFTNNKADDGGCIYIIGNNTKINTNTKFESNNATNGAGIYIEGSNTQITSTTFKNNIAENGAGVYIKGQNTNIASSTFDSNNATDGGAAYINGHNSVISSNTFTKNNVTDQGGAIFIQGSGSTIRGNTFTENEAVPASAEGTTGLGGAIYVKGDNTLTDTNTFDHNKARNGSAIYTDGKNFNLQHDVFNENQAWSYLLIVDPVPKVSYYNTTDHNITIVHVGGDNIINAIHNTANNNEIHFLDVTYHHSDGDTVNTGNTVVEPVNGAREGVLYQDDRENLQEIFVTVTHVESGDIILNYERYVTNIYGEVNITLKRPTRAVIQLDNPLPVGNYSVYAIHPEDWNYKVIENRSAFEILPYVDISTEKDSDKDEYYVGDTAIWTITVHNADNGTNATNVTVTDKLPSGFAFVSYVASQGNYDANTGIWYIGNMTNGSSVQLTINSIATFADNYNNIANASSNETDWNLTNNEDNKTVKVLPVVNLTIDKSVNVDVVYVGENVIFTINVTNNGPSNATVVTIEDIVPEQFNVTACNDTKYVDNKLIIDQLNVGESYAFTITATALINGTWNNTANVTCKENDTVINDTVTVIVDPVVNLTINKTVEPGRVKVGETVVFTINVTNNGPSNATMVEITDIVPEQFNVTACNDSSFINNKIIIEKLNVGESYVITINATALIAGTWNNTASVFCAENDTIVNDTVNVTVDPVVNLTIDKAVDYDHVQVGDTIVFTINVTNNGPSNATVVTLEDIVPEQFNVTGCNDSAYVDNKIIIDQLNVGESYAFTITATALIAGTWNNTANVTCKENDTVINDTVTVIVDPVVNLTINKTVEPGTVKVGETVVFTINVTNNGPSNATQVVIEDIVPEQFNVTACNDSAFINNKIIIEKLNVGESYAFTITATALINGTWNNTANVTCAENDTVVNDTVTVIVDPVVNLSINKTVEPGRVYVGETVLFTINITNNGPSNATQVEVTDIVPEQFGNIICNDSAYSNNKIIIAKLNVGESYVFTLNATALINGTWDNVASAFCAENDTVVEDDAIVIVDPVVNLTVNKTVEPGKVYVGETVVFTINVTNNGPSNATMVEITDVVPEQFGNVVCNDTRFENNKIIIERLDVNESIVFTLTATALINGTWNNTASAFCAENDTEVNDTVNVTVDPIVDVSTEKTSDKDVYFVDDIALWTITVHNANNASNATNVKLLESLPSEFEYLGYFTLNGTYDNETEIWDIGFMANGTDARLLIFARAIKVKDRVTNMVGVTCDEEDWNLSNNIAFKTVDIIPLPDPEKNVSNSTPYYHDEVLYYLTINNTGNITYENVLKVIDSLPEGLEFVRTVSIENADQVDEESIEGQTITWTITNIPAFTKAVITVLVKVNALGNLTNNLTVVGPNGTNQTVNATIDPVPIVDLSTNKTSDKEAYFVDDIVIWSITVHNADNGTNATDVILKDEIPSQFEFINYTATKGTYDKETGIWNISFMENGTDATLTIWTIAKVAVDQVTNTANVTCKETDWNLSNNVDNETIEIIPLPDPVKTVSNSTPYYHDIVEYNLTIINDGDIDYTNNLTVVDSLPEGLVFIETVGIVNGKFVGDEVIGTNNVTWVITNISAKTNATIIVKVKVEALGDLTNNLTIIGPNGTNKTVNETVTPVPIVDLSTDKTSDRDEYFVDDIAVWTITVHNADNGTNATNVALEDHIPTQFVFINYTATNGTYDHNTGIWTIGFMGNGTDATLTIWTRAVTPIDEVTNYANVSCYEDEWDLSNNDDEKTVSIIKLPEPQKTVSNATPYNRDNVTYNLTITNVGNITYTNVLTVIDSLPEGLKFIETVGIDGADLIEEIVDGQKITWTITNISAESSAVITVKVLVMDIGNQTNNLTIVGPNGTNSTVNCTIDPVPIADLAVTKINDYSTKACYNGDNVTWTISVINNGPNDAINSIASDILPAGLIYVSDDSNGAYDPITGIWTIGNLSVGSSATLTIVTTVATSNETITNYVNVTSDTYDPDESNNEDNSSVVVEPEADLGIIKLVSNETVHKGDIVTWTLIVTNYGTDAAINVVVTDKLPKGLVHIADNSLGAYNPTTGIWNVGNLACGESATLKIKSLVKTTNKNITNLATVDSDTYDHDKSNNNANNSTIVPPECDLVLTIDPNVVEVTVGDEVEFTVTVVNKGPDTAENATAFIEIPDELKLLGFKPSKGTYDPETGIWTIGDLAPGEKVTLILDTEALETGKFVVKAHVVCDTYETNYTNNNDSAEVTVIEPPEPPVPDVPPQEMYPTGNPIVLALLSVLVIVGMTLRRKS